MHSVNVPKFPSGSAMSCRGWDSNTHSVNERRRTGGRDPRDQRTSTPEPNNEANSSEEFSDELNEFVYHFWLKALQKNDRRQRRCLKFKKRRNLRGSAISLSSSERPATTTSSSVSPPNFNFLVANPFFQPMFAPHLPVTRHYIMSHTYRPSENPAKLVFIRPSPLYLPPPNAALYCCPVLGYYENGTLGVIPYAYYCFYM